MIRPADSQRPASGRGTYTPGALIRTISSRTMRKSSPLGSPLEKAPGTFSQTIYRGRTDRPVRPCSRSASLISFTIRHCSINRPERAPASPALAPATLRSWHGLPPQMISTGGSPAPSSFVISPTWIMSGNLSFVTSMGKASISLAHTGVTPLRIAAKGKPPIPSKRLPIVSMVRYTWSRRDAFPQTAFLFLPFPAEIHFFFVFFAFLLTAFQVLRLVHHLPFLLFLCFRQS